MQSRRCTLTTGIVWWVIVTITLLIIIIAVVVAVAGITMREMSYRKESALSNNLEGQVRQAIASGDQAQQRQLAAQVLRSNPLVAGATGRGFSITATLIGICLLGGAVLLMWGMAGVLADYRYHNAPRCRVDAVRNCLLAIPGTITEKDLAGHHNNLYVETSRGPDMVGIFGNIHSVPVGEAVTIDAWNGAWVFVDTPQGRFDTDVYTGQIEIGLGIGLALIAPSVFFIRLLRRMRRALRKTPATLGGA